MGKAGETGPGTVSLWMLELHHQFNGEPMIHALVTTGESRGVASERARARKGKVLTRLGVCVVEILALLSGTRQ